MKTKNVRKLLITFMLIITTLILTSCVYGEMYNELDELTGLSRDEASQERYTLNDVSIWPVINMCNPRDYDVVPFNMFRLSVVSSKDLNDDSQVIINSVTVEGVSNIKFKEISKDLDENMEFSGEGNDGYVAGKIVAFEEINDYNMRLNNKSQIKVTINATVINGEESVTKDIETIFKYKKYNFSKRFDIFMWSV